MIYDLQKASMWKRISALLFDGILLAVLICAFALLLSAIFGFDSYIDTFYGAYAKYETDYGVTFEITQEEYTALSEEARQTYNAAFDALNGDDAAMYAYSMMLNLILLITSLSILLGYLALEFLVPILFGNGQTLGKKIFGICLMRVDGIRINHISLFVRTLLGKFTIETMIPALLLFMIFFGTIGIVGPIILLAILLLQIILMIATHTNSAIHDRLANTVVVDYASQMIFDTEEDMLACKKRIAAEKAERQDY